MRGAVGRRWSVRALAARIVGGVVIAATAAGLGAAFEARVAALQPGGASLIAPEVSALARVREQLQAFDRQAQALARRPTITKGELEQLQRQAESAKALLPDAERQLASSISKLRGAGKWTAEFDAAINAALQKSGKTDVLREVQSAGGARAVVEAAARGVRQAGADIDSTVRGLQPRAVWQRLVDPVLDLVRGTPVHAAYTVRTVSLAQALLCLYQGIYTAYCGL